MDWLNSGGGPFIFADADTAKQWRGTGGSSVNGGVTDYARACGVEGYLGLTRCGLGEALVLGDEPLQTAIDATSHGIVLIRWVYCDSMKCAEDAVANLPSEFRRLRRQSNFVYYENEQSYSTPHGI